ncbi:hypothetical protein NLJ89_g3365 [Agrocybe chaxingu]|uniref:Meiotically up-regulated gene 152 protein n=1 Tax=Agrocybe chaxingu TaxID=84603 RepID=A0A9W8K501_9AGAR|nr:hypothetical protein NLJ89_g3365 [Agrocybe chaxingu]
MASNNGDSSNNHPPASGVPSSSTFSFKAPFPVPVAPSAAVTALKQRRVSLASPSSPRLVQPWSFRDEMGLDAHSVDAESASTSETGRVIPEKKGKMRKIDTSKNSDESSVLEKKPRKKWSQEETQMLVDGCQTHGVGNWKTILQDPNLHFHDRTAVDLKDRFRTYFPDAYKKHYPNAKTHLSSKIRSTFADGTSLFEKTRSKRRRPFTEAEDRALKAGYEKHGTTWATIVKDPIFQEQNRRSTDLRDRFRNAFPHLYQAAGYKPRTATKKKVDGPVRAADDQLSTMSSAGPVRSRRRAQTSLRGGIKSVPQSAVCSEDEDSSAGEEEEETSVFKKPKMPVLVDNVSTSPLKKSSPPNSSLTATSNGSSAAGTFTTPRDSYMDADDEMELITIETDPLNIPDFMPNDSHSDMETWSSGINTPTHSSTAAWSTAGASPTSSHFSDFLLTGSSAAASNNPSNASSPFMQRRNDVSANNFIGKSAWGAQDWFSANPRLDASSASSSSSFIDANFSPASPFSLGQHFSHGVLDRYDLFPPSMPNDIMSDAGVGDSHNSFTEGSGGGPSGASAGGTGFRGYHSQIAGDLISGASARPSFSSTLSLSLAGLYSQHFGNAFGNTAEMGLGLEGIPEDAGIHPMQLHAHNSALLGIEELGLTGISLNDHVDSVEPNSAPSADDAMDGSSTNNMPDMSSFGIHSPDKRRDQQQQTEANEREKLASSILNDPFNLEDLVDMSNEAHATPPATPLMTQPRPMRRSSGGTLLNNFGDSGAASGHARSISVPPTEARNSGQGTGVAMAMDDVGLHMQSSHNVMNFGKSLQSIFHPPPQPSTPSRPQHRPRNSEPMRLSNSTGSMSPPALPHHHSDATIFPAHLMLSSTSATALAPSGHPQNHVQDPWRLSNTSWMNPNTISPSDLYNVPYLDLHYSLTYGHPGLNGLDVTLDNHSEARQGQALDLAQSAVLASSGIAGLNKPFEHPTTVRPHQLTSKPMSSSFVA